MTGYAVEALGNVLVKLDKFERGTQLLLRALNINREHLGDRSASTARLHKRVSFGLMKMGRNNDAHWHLQQALAIAQSLYGELSEEVADALHHQGQLAASQGQFETAERLFSEALAKYQRIAPTNVETLELLKWRLECSQKRKVVSV